ncbi:hypothetical protein C8Q80DRAFT_1156005 [Daedaleopsis nitida]|nr:hypothetical protein C8Q80DRAFT_1156005 [Daedaleopsis nitida]
MPGPAVYAVVGVVAFVAVGIAFHELVYEPHIAPKVEAWAENYLERRRQRRRQRQGPTLAQPVRDDGDENSSRRSSVTSDDRSPGPHPGGDSIELEQLAATERNVWRDPSSMAGLRHRRATGLMDESNTVLAHPIITPTHVIIDGSEPPSPGGRSIRTSAPPSVDNSPAHSVIGLQPPSPRSPSPRADSPRMLTPISNSSSLSSPVMTPATTLSERSPLSSRRPTPDIAASQPLTSAYNTPLGGSMVSEDGRLPHDVQSFPSTRIQSPFSDIYSVDAHSSPEQVFTFTSPAQVRSPSIGSDLTLDSDDEFDILSPRTGIFSPDVASHVDDDLFDAASQHGSETSWASVGRRSPVDF